MNRAIELAKKGAGGVNPNPFVGAVIVKENRIIGEGWHAKFGEFHAERNALKNAKERGEDVSGSEMYVTLEPCCHQGHQPPCTEAILSSGIKRVYVGSDDPNPLVAGKGLEFLRKHGIEVITHVMKTECDELNDVFFHYISYKMPYVIYKYAMTLDGKNSSYTGDAKWVSNEKSRQKTHEMRNLYTSIMVGIGTVIADDPMLDTRYIDGGRNPIRIVVDSKLRIPENSKIISTSEKIRTIVACSDCAKNEKKEKIMMLEQNKVEVISASSSAADKVDVKVLLKKIGEIGIDSVMLEGGGTLAWSFVNENLIDEIHIFIAPKIIGGENAGTPVKGKGFEKMQMAREFSLCSMEKIGSDVELIYKKHKSEK